MGSSEQELQSCFSSICPLLCVGEENRVVAQTVLRLVCCSRAATDVKSMAFLRICSNVLTWQLPRRATPRSLFLASKADMQMGFSSAATDLEL